MGRMHLMVTILFLFTNVASQPTRRADSFYNMDQSWQILKSLKVLYRKMAEYDEVVKDVCKANDGANEQLYEKLGNIPSLEWNRHTVAHFPNKDQTTDYIRLQETLPALSAFTICISTRIPYNGVISFFSYAVPNNNNEILIHSLKPNKMRVFVKTFKDQNINFGFHDNKWHQLCLAWQSRGGLYTWFVDGEMRYNGTGLQTGSKTKAGGVIILGQEQDKVGGGFDRTQSFYGSMNGLYIWDRYLNQIPECPTNANIYSWGINPRPNFHGATYTTTPWNNNCQKT